MGKRAEKKIYYRNAILSSAKEMFEKFGFENTTIEQIAQNANIGLGTAYNYFSSKEELYISSMLNILTTSENSSFDVNAYNSSNTVEAIFDLVSHELSIIKIINKKVWQTAMPAIFASFKSDSVFFKKVLAVDLNIIDKIKSILINHKEKGFFDVDLDIEITTNTLFGTIIFQVFYYIYTDEVDFDYTLQQIKDSIQFTLR